MSLATDTSTGSCRFFPRHPPIPSPQLGICCRLHRFAGWNSFPKGITLTAISHGSWNCLSICYPVFPSHTDKDKIIIDSIICSNLNEIRKPHGNISFTKQKSKALLTYIWKHTMPSFPNASSWILETGRPLHFALLEVILVIYPFEI